MKAKLSSYRCSPRKVRLVARLLKGRKVDEAADVLRYTPKKSSEVLKKLLLAAVANAKDKGVDKKDLYVESVRVDGGRTLKRIRPASRGSAHGIKKRTSRVELLLRRK